MVTFSMDPKPGFQGNGIYEVESLPPRVRLTDKVAIAQQ